MSLDFPTDKDEHLLKDECISFCNSKWILRIHLESMGVIAAHCKEPRLDTLASSVFNFSQSTIPWPKVLTKIFNEPEMVHRSSGQEEDEREEDLM